MDEFAVVPAVDPAAREVDFAIDTNDPLAQLISWRGKKKWWQVMFAVFLVYGIAEKFLLPWWQGYLQIGGDLSAWRPDLEALLTGLAWFPGIFAYYIWSAESIPQLFRDFDRSELFESGTKYREFIERERTKRMWFTRAHWTLVSFLIAVGASVFVFHLYLWDSENPIPVEPWFTAGEPQSRWVAVILLTIVFYVGAQVLIREFVLSIVLHRLWKQLGGDLRLRSKRDEVGGLGLLARHVTSVAIVMTLAFMTLAMATALAPLRGEQADADFAVWVVAMWVIYFAVVSIVLRALLWPAHKAMRNKRNNRLAGIADRIDRLTPAVEEAVRAEKIDSVQAEFFELDQLQKLHSWLENDLPAWPLSRAITARLSWTVAIPFAYSIATLVLDLTTG